MQENTAVRFHSHRKPQGAIRRRAIMITTVAKGISKRRTCRRTSSNSSLPYGACVRMGWSGDVANRSDDWNEIRAARFSLSVWTYVDARHRGADRVRGVSERHRWWPRNRTFFLHRGAPSPVLSPRPVDLVVGGDACKSARKTSLELFADRKNKSDS